jgi:hypothetical protein
VAFNLLGDGLRDAWTHACAMPRSRTLLEEATMAPVLLEIEELRTHFSPVQSGEGS